MNPDSDPREALCVAKTLADLGQLVDAESVLVAGLRLVRELPRDFDETVEQLGLLYARTRNHRRALSCAWYAEDFEKMSVLDGCVPARERARSMALRAKAPGVSGAERETWHVRAAEAFEADHRWVHAASQWTEADRHDRALLRWQQLARGLAARRLIAVESLCRIEEARSAWRMGDASTADKACERGVRLLQVMGDLHASGGRADLAAEAFERLALLATQGEHPELAARARASMARWTDDFSSMELRLRVRRGGCQRVDADLLVWECGWEPSELAADWFVHSPRDFTRELVLELRLLALETDGMPSGAVMYALSRLAHGLGDGGFEAIRPLELISSRRVAAVRVAVARSLGRLPYERSLRALTMALHDPAPEVVAEARKSIASMRKPALLGGVMTLIGTGAYGQGYRRSASQEATRRAAFQALAGMDGQARDVIQAILAYGGASDRRMLRAALDGSGHTAANDAS